MDKRPQDRSRVLEICAAIGLGIEALVLVMVAVAYGIYVALGGAQGAGFYAAVGAFCLMLGVGVGFGARGTWQSRRWARSIALTWQVFQIGLGLAVLSTQPILGIALIAVAVAVAACVLARASRDDALAGADLLDG